MTTNVSPAVLAQSVTLTTGAVVYITGPANSQVIIKQAVFSNFISSAATFTVWHVPSGGTPINANLLINQRSIPAFPGTDLCPELINMVLAPGDTIQCGANTATAVNFTASGFIAT